MWMNYTDIESLEKKPELPCAELCYISFLLRPFEPVFLKSFLPQAKTVSVPIENLHHCPSSIGEDKEMPREGIELHCSLYQDGKTIDGFAHIRIAQGKKNPCVRRCMDHRRLNIRMT